MFTSYGAGTSLWKDFKNELLKAFKSFEIFSRSDFLFKLSPSVNKEVLTFKNTFFFKFTQQILLIGSAFRAYKTSWVYFSLFYFRKKLFMHANI